MARPCALGVRHLTKAYGEGSARRVVLDDVSLELASPGLVAVLGESGCGKTTLLNVLGGLDRDFAGSLAADGREVGDLSPRELDRLRARRVGFVFQDPCLTDYLTVLENVRLGCDLATTPEPREAAERALARVGIAELADAMPPTLSGGQAQRVAVARALAKDPDVILADEPTGSLDRESGLRVMSLLAELARERLVVVVTHNEALARRFATRIVRIADGQVAADERTVAETGEPTETEPNTQALAETYEPTHPAAGDAGAGAAPPDANGTSPARRRTRDRSRHGAAIRRLALHHLLRSRLRTAVTVAACAVSVLGLALVLALGAGGQSFVEGLYLSTVLEQPLRASADPTAGMRSVRDAAARGASSDGDASDAVGGAAGTSDAVGIDGAGLEALRSSASDLPRPDLGGLYAYLTQSRPELAADVLDVQRSWQVELNLYEPDGTQVLRAGQAVLADRLSVGQAAGEGAKWQMGDALSGADVMREVVTDDATGEGPYEVLAGRMPEDASELVLITDGDGRVLDYLAYALGLADDGELAETLRGEQVDPTRSVPYDEVLGRTYLLVPTSSYYYPDGDHWADARDDPSRMPDVLARARELTVVGVVRPRAPYAPDFSAGALGYHADLLPSLIDDAWASGVVRAQAADPATDVFTGRTFAEEAAGTDASEADIAELVALARSIGLSEGKVEQVEALNAEQVEALREQRGVSRDADGALVLDPEDAAELRSMSDEEFARTIERYAPASLNTSYAQNMEWLGAADPERPDELLIYPRGAAGAERVRAAVADYDAMFGGTVAPVTCASSAQGWLDQVTATIAAVRQVLALLVGVALALGAFLVLSTTYVSAVERRREVALLRAMGATRRDVTALFGWENAVVGAVAGAAGALAAMASAPALDAYVAQVAGRAEMVAVPAWALVPAVCAGVALATLAGWLPARRAAAADPADALRGGMR